MRSEISILVFMGGISTDQIYRVRQYGFQDLETFLHALWRSGKIYYQRSPANTADTAGKHRERSFRGGFAAHRFGQSRRFATDDAERGLGSIVTWAETGPPGRNDQVYIVSLGQIVQRFQKLQRLIGNDHSLDDLTVN